MIITDLSCHIWGRDRVISLKAMPFDMRNQQISGLIHINIKSNTYYICETSGLICLDLLLLSKANTSPHRHHLDQNIFALGGQLRNTKWFATLYIYQLGR